MEPPSSHTHITSRMPAAACITAWELTGQANENMKAVSGGGFRTPYGTFSDIIFFVGTLTEKNLKNGQINSLRVSDPTGVITLSLPQQNTALLRDADALDVPGFVSVTATVKHRTSGKTSYLEIVPDLLISCDRKTQDAWLCCATASALSRLESLPLSTGRQEFAEILIKALENVRDTGATPVAAVAAEHEVTDEQLLAIITELSGKKGAPIADVISRAGTLGMNEAWTKAALARLMEEGECYTPTTELIKVA